MQSIQELKIPTNKIFYDTKTDVLSVYLLDIVFIGNYKKSTKLSRILDDIFDSLNINSLLREDISIVDFITNSPISENTPLKKLSLISKQQVEKLKEKKIKEAIEPQEVEKDTSKSKKKAKAFASPKRKAEEPVYADELLKQEEEEFMEESYIKLEYF